MKLRNRLVSVCQSICPIPIRSAHDAAAGLLPRAGDVDRLLHGGHQQPRRSSGVRRANAGSATLIVDVGS